MKELSIEQKAKRYDEAIEIARQYYNDRAMPIGTNFKLERMFPELKESEDEKIRKELISFVRGMLACHDKPNAERDEKYESWIAWLEKQAEQKHTPKHKIGDTIYYNSFGEVKSMVVSDVAIDGTDNPMYEDKDGNAVFEKDLIEQKPTDKAEPKFKQGDWIIFNGLTLQVKGVVKGFYITTSKDGITNGYDWSIDNAARLWTIQDVKDGDVLVLNNEVFIYSHRKQMYSIAVAHCFVDSAGSFYLDGEFGYKEYGKTISPATKEQRDTLMKAMADAGYTFDFDKKELKNIEQKHARCAWTEGDEKQARQIKRIVHNDGCSKKLQEQIANWFKSLKDRVQPQQEWSEEDKTNASYICAALDCYYRLREDRNNTNGQENLDKARNWLYNRLKSLRPQNSSVTDEELAQAKKDAYNEALDKIEYHSGEPTFDDGWDAAIWYLKKRNTKDYE